MTKLLFLSGSRWEDRLITLAEGWEFPHIQNLATHVALLRDDNTGVEAVFPRVHQYTEDKYGGHNYRLYPLTLSWVQNKMLWHTAEQYVGARYDLPGLLIAAWYSLTGRPSKFLENEKARVFCSELVVVCLRRAGIPVLGAIPPDNVTPAALEAWIQTEPVLVKPHKSRGI